ncbi:hypothetical protein A2U01_0009642, partial [Trifolium medium]|nr:hypothetical protein [Trifolium medium]
FLEAPFSRAFRMRLRVRVEETCLRGFVDKDCFEHLLRFLEARRGLRSTWGVLDKPFRFLLPRVKATSVALECLLNSFESRGGFPTVGFAHPFICILIRFEPLDCLYQDPWIKAVVRMKVASLNMVPFKLSDPFAASTTVISCYLFFNQNALVKDSDARVDLWEPYSLDFIRIFRFPSFGYPFAVVLVDDDPRPFT